MVAFFLLIAVACIPMLVIVLIARALLPPQRPDDGATDLLRADDASTETIDSDDALYTGAKGRVWIRRFRK